VKAVGEDRCLGGHVDGVHAAAAERGVGEQQEVLAIGRHRVLPGGGEAECLLEGLDPPANLVRQYAADLRERASASRPSRRAARRPSATAVASAAVSISGGMR
jgi:hypothetical protein